MLDQIVRTIADRSLGLFDKQMATNVITQAEYDEEVRELEKWVRDMHCASQKNELSL